MSCRPPPIIIPPRSPPSPQRGFGHSRVAQLARVAEATDNFGCALCEREAFWIDWTKCGPEARCPHCLCPTAAVAMPTIGAPAVSNLPGFHRRMFPTTSNPDHVRAVRESVRDCSTWPRWSHAHCSCCRTTHPSDKIVAWSGGTAVCPRCKNPHLIPALAEELNSELWWSIVGGIHWEMHLHP